MNPAVRVLLVGDRAGEPRHGAVPLLDNGHVSQQIGPVKTRVIEFSAQPGNLRRQPRRIDKCGIDIL
ncbi:MAG: hypothetical protein ACRDRK_13740 [Pseudonocardia sp.]